MDTRYKKTQGNKIIRRGAIIVILVVAIILTVFLLKEMSQESFVTANLEEFTTVDLSAFEEEELASWEAEHETDAIDMDAEFPYIIYVNRALNRVVIYGIDSEGEYSIPYLGFICSVGIDENTPIGVYTISDKYEWRELVDGSYGQYACRIVDGILFHSVPYTEMAKNALEIEEYNKLGTAASLGCVRLTVEGAKWIYDNCSEGTTVVIYDDEEENFAVEFNPIQIIELDSENAGWDPTDPDEDNPWNE